DSQARPGQANALPYSLPGGDTAANFNKRGGCSHSEQGAENEKTALAGAAFSSLGWREKPVPMG
ncbi:hypothetical protein SCY21_20600, partial [Xanthomonas euvesicatoria]|uniref:hypothetical protein n=2 Tax=Xanthomonas euvesicatoria TaxID=456327 RepID=UPI00298D65F5